MMLFSPDIQINLSVLYYCWIRITIASLNQLILYKDSTGTQKTYRHFTPEQ